ncbi:hypothetical protein CYMTET_38977 [Cymbomonas tetramitiformis]|uniref:Uncharacterized protein n=1 Tax=Cymbomonas tetramitiformis TaxID=36881 RepID=A0AAE0CCQ0_9CHLO|nr:hypothetical protein CYMTET_38977 [Cymbomonas tetramitiformis]
MADDKGIFEGDHTITPPPTRPAAIRKSNLGMEASLAQQTALLNTMMQQLTDLKTRVEEAEEMSALAEFQGGGPAQR